MQQLLETVRIKVNFIHISVLNYLFVLKNVRHFIPNCWLRNEIAEQEQIFALNETNFFLGGGEPEMYWENYQSFIYSPTDARVSCLLKTILKFTLKQLRHVSVLQLHHHQIAH